MEFTKENGYAKEKDFINSVNEWIVNMELFAEFERTSQYTQSFYACYGRAAEELTEMERRGWNTKRFWDRLNEVAKSY